MDIISSLETELDRIVEKFEIPAAEITEAIAGLVEQRRWDVLEKHFGEEGVRPIRELYNADPIRIVRDFREAAEKCRSRFVEDASKQLTRLNRSNFSKQEPQDFAEWLQVALDPQHNLLTVAFAYKLVGLIEPASVRAQELKDLVVAEASSAEADAYLSEACECYFLGLYTASAVMCRSLLEEALERKLPTELLDKWKSEATSPGGKTELTLGALLTRVNNHHPLCVDPKFLTLARQANEIASRAAHSKAIGQLDSRKCLLKTREAIGILLGGDASTLVAGRRRT